MMHKQLINDLNSSMVREAASFRTQMAGLPNVPSKLEMAKAVHDNTITAMELFHEAQMKKANDFDKKVGEQSLAYGKELLRIILDDIRIAISRF